MKRDARREGVRRQPLAERSVSRRLRLDSYRRPGRRRRGSLRFLADTPVPATAGREVIVLVHGIWMQGFMMRVLADFLQQTGFDTRTFSYDFLRRSPAENATLLAAKADRLYRAGAAQVHLVGHSLGGIVILHLLDQARDLPPGKVVLIGSPVRGSSVAERLHRHWIFRPLLGRSVERGLLGGAPQPDENRPLGIITGTWRFGISSVLQRTTEGNDGVVSDSETRLDNTTDRVRIPGTHSSMIFSRGCARQIAHFLRNNRFAA